MHEKRTDGRKNRNLRHLIVIANRREQRAQRARRLIVDCRIFLVTKANKPDWHADCINNVLKRSLSVSTSGPVDTSLSSRATSLDESENLLNSAATVSDGKSSGQMDKWHHAIMSRGSDRFCCVY